jgi:hypothetical protein
MFKGLDDRFSMSRTAGQLWPGTKLARFSNELPGIGPCHLREIRCFVI